MSRYIDFTGFTSAGVVNVVSPEEAERLGKAFAEADRAYEAKGQAGFDEARLAFIALYKEVVCAKHTSVADDNATISEATAWPMNFVIAVDGGGDPESIHIAISGIDGELEEALEETDMETVAKLHADKKRYETALAGLYLREAEQKELSAFTKKCVSTQEDLWDFPDWWRINELVAEAFNRRRQAAILQRGYED